MAPRSFAIDALAERLVEALTRLGPLPKPAITLEPRATSPRGIEKPLAAMMDDGRVVASIEEVTRQSRLNCVCGWHQRRYRATVYRLAPGKRPPKRARR